MPRRFPLILPPGLVRDTESDLVAPLSSTILPERIRAEVIEAGSSEVWLSRDGTNPIDHKLRWDTDHFFGYVDVGSVTAGVAQILNVMVGDDPGGWSNDPFKANRKQCLLLSDDKTDFTTSGNDGGNTTGGSIGFGAVAGPDGAVPAATFSGSQYFAGSPGTTIGSNGVNITMALWFRNTHSSDIEVMYEMGGNSYGVVLATQNGRVYGTATNNSAAQSLSVAYTSGVWNHVQFIVEGTALRLYLNGLLVATGLYTKTGTDNFGTDSGGVGGVAGGGARMHTGASSVLGDHQYAGDLFALQGFNGIRSDTATLLEAKNGGWRSQVGRVVTNSGAGRKARTFPVSDYDFSLAQEVRQSASGGTATSYEENDTEVTRTSPATVTNEADVTIEGPTLGVLDKGITYTTRDPDIATVDQVGQVTRVADGTARIVVETPFVKRKIDVPVSEQVSAEGITYDARVEGSLAKHCDDQIDAMILGRTKATNSPMFTDLPNRIRNANNLLTLAGVDNTCIDVEKPNACLIAAQYGLQAEHYKDATDVYVAADGTVHTRSVIGRVDIGPANSSDFYETDISVVKYDTPLPASITPAKFAPANIDNYLPSISAVNHLHCIATDQEKKILINELISMTSTRLSYRQPNEAPRNEFGEALIGGDSGSPGFLLVNGELVYMVLWTFGGGGGGPKLAANLTAIQSAIDTLEGGAGVTIQTADLSGFVDYTAHNLLLDSGDLSTSNWEKRNSFAQDGTTTAPDGSSTPWWDFSDSAVFGDATTSLIGETYTNSVWLKASVGGETIGLRVPDGTIGGQGSGANIDIQPTTDWARYQVSAVLSTDAPRLLLEGRSSSGYTMPTGYKLAVWHPQINTGSTPKGYQGT